MKYDEFVQIEIDYSIIIAASFCGTFNRQQEKNFISVFRNMFDNGIFVVAVAVVQLLSQASVSIKFD